MTDPEGGRRRTGRRPGKPDTRAHILDVAQAAFVRDGFERTSMRGIAREAGVDPALVHRYFGSKKDLLLAAVQLGMDPTAVAEALVAEGMDRHMGARIVYVVTGLWEQRLGPTWVTTLRENPALMRVMIGFLNPVVTDAYRRLTQASAEEARLRGSLVELVMSGVAMTRYVARLEPLGDLTREEFATIVGPAVDHLLTCELPSRDGRGFSRRSHH